MASAGQTEDKNGSNLSASSGRLPQVYQGEYGGAPQIGSTICFSHKQKSRLESSGNDPEILNNTDQAFLMNHIRKGTRGTYRPGWNQFQSFCKVYEVNAQLAPLPLIV